MGNVSPTGYEYLNDVIPGFRQYWIELFLRIAVQGVCQRSHPLGRLHVHRHTGFKQNTHHIRMAGARCNMQGCAAHWVLREGIHSPGEQACHNLCPPFGCRKFERGGVTRSRPGRVHALLEQEGDDCRIPAVHSGDQRILVMMRTAQQRVCPTFEQQSCNGGLAAEDGRDQDGIDPR